MAYAPRDLDGEAEETQPFSASCTTFPLQGGSDAFSAKISLISSSLKVKPQIRKIYLLLPLYSISFLDVVPSHDVK